MALEQLCMLLLMSDNIDRCFESCPPRTFIPALCRIFLDETATDNVLEVGRRVELAQYFQLKDFHVEMIGVKFGAFYYKNNSRKLYCSF